MFGKKKRCSCDTAKSVANGEFSIENLLSMGRVHQQEADEASGLRFDVKHLCKQMVALMDHLGLEFVESTERVTRGQVIEEETRAFVRVKEVRKRKK